MTISIEDERAFTAWISLKLESLTKYDPKRLSAYLVAVIKKNGIDKDFQSLKSLCKRKLNAFFEDKAKLDDICEEVVSAAENHKYEEVRSHPAYANTGEDANSVMLNSEFSQTENKPYRADSPDAKRAEILGKSSGDEEEFGDDSLSQDKSSVKPKTRSVSPARNPGSESVLVDDGKRNKRTAVAPSRITCKDFTERGFCMRGQYCPFDHGSDPVVWQNARPLEVIRYTGPHIPALPPQPVRLPAFPPMPLPMIRPVLPPRFRPDAAVLPPPYIRPQKASSMRPRELVGLSVGGSSSFNFGEGFRGPDITKRESDSLMDSPLKRLALSEPTDNCTLEIRHVPDQLNNISALNAHFSKYGSIVNVQVRYGSDHKAALVTFQTPEAAARAFRSPEPVLNNRFIAISWHTDPSKDTTKVSPINKVAPAATVKAIAPAPAPKTEPDNQRTDVHTAPSADETVESAVTPGFTRGVRVRYPVGSRRARAGRFRGGATRGRAVSESNVSQANSIATHQKLIYSTLEVTKTETEIDKIQAQITTLDELISKLNGSISSYHGISEQYRSRMETDPSAKKEEIGPLLDKIEKQIAQWQIELKKHEEEKLLAVRKRTVMEQKLNLQQSQNEILKAKLEGESSVRGSGDTLKDVDSARSYSARAGHNRPAPYRSPKSPRRATGGSRFRRPVRGGPFNRVIDRRPKRVKISGFLENERANILRHVQSCGAKVISNSTNPDEPPSMVLDFNIRYEGDACLRDLAGLVSGRKLAVMWLTEAAKTEEDMEQAEGTAAHEQTPVAELSGDTNDVDLATQSDFDYSHAEENRSFADDSLEGVTEPEGDLTKVVANETT
ncbi:RNA-binding protein 27-like [Paramacrobiotus metropolitanus]|uniref:RNA-binding protein 27-like n=1 Tax=Paramacrobiotus metropolitanus TaxID=2943436 RepID=UPI0024460CA1|nr:RNA-binding protein 27-like [Paramacrobiotus metropolitanus]